TTDRGITLFRNQIRRGIRAVKAGQEPIGLFRDGGGGIPTYCNDTGGRIPPAKTPDLDKKLMPQTGRRPATAHMARPPQLLLRNSGAPRSISLPFDPIGELALRRFR